MSDDDVQKWLLEQECEKVAIEGDDWTWTGKVFQTVAAATGNERRPMVVRRYDGTNSSSVDDDRRRRRPGRSDTRTSWFKCASAMPWWTWYAISASLKFTRSGRRSQCNIARTTISQNNVYNAAKLICSMWSGERPYTSWIATLKSDLSVHNLTFEDAIELAMDKPLWRLLVASRATHWHGACRIMMMMMTCILVVYFKLRLSTNLTSTASQIDSRTDPLVC